MKKPVILVTHKYADAPADFGAGRWVRLKESYLHAIAKAGGVPILSALGDAERYAAMADGIQDLHRYGHKAS